MSEQTESRLLKTAAGLRAPLLRLADLATEEAQQNWELAHWQRFEAVQAVHESCQTLIESLEHVERILSQEPPKQPKRKP